MNLEEYYDDIYRYCFFRMQDRSRLGAHRHIDCSGSGSADTQRVRPRDHLSALCTGAESR